MTYGDDDRAEFEELREEIEASIEKSKRLVALSRELIGAAAAQEEESEPPAIAPHPKLGNPSA